MRTVEVEHLWKSYLGGARLGIKELLIARRSTLPDRFARQWALQDVSFSVSRGQSFGIVGHNGTGKSTLLSLLLGTLTPDKGRAQVSGRVASLLELGAGFHPELSGRENIFLYGVILGMTRREIRSVFQQVTEFSELGDAIEAPLRTYSSGMITRLGFSTIIHAPADVLLIDEVLAVGDARFQEKCRTYLKNFRRHNGTLVIVSHDMPALAEMCDEGVCLNIGKVVHQGNMMDVISYYEGLVHQTPLDAVVTTPVVMAQGGHP
jgi:lipopolysaccharide transport system ATP-binding protein